MDEQRTTSRAHAFRPGTIQLGASSVSCIVRNVSDAGAALDVVSPHGIPDQFILVLTLDGVRHSCRVVWRQDMRLGVAFGALPE
jgi:PilZ domain